MTDTPRFSLRRSGRRLSRLAAGGLCGLLAAVCLCGAPTEGAPTTSSPAASATVLLAGDGQSVRPEPTGTAASAPLEENDRLACENERLALYLDRETFLLKVLDKRTGYLWSGGLSQAAADEMTGTWKRFSRAFLTMDYFNVTGASLRSSARFRAADADLQITGDSIAATLRFQEPNATARVYVTLTETGFSVRVPDDEIVFHNPDNRLGKLYVLPFFGAVLSDSVPGYFVIPDGCGALMRFTKPATYGGSTQLRFYGRDASITAGTDTGSRLTLPCYGAVHGSGQNAFLCTVTGGDTCAGLEISPAGVKIDYHWLSPVFYYREQYRQSTGASVGFDVIQKTPNRVDPVLTYTLLSGEDADYVGLAKAYRQTLSLPEWRMPQGEMPVLVQALMADRCKSLLGAKTKVLTTLADAADWQKQLQAAGVQRVWLSIAGFASGGSSGEAADRFRLDRRIGSEAALSDLRQSLTQADGGLLLVKDFARVYPGQAKRSRYLYAANRVFTATPDNGRLFDARYYLDLPAVSSLFEKAAGLSTPYNSLALPAVGSTLYSNFKENRETSRADMRQAIVQGLANCRQAGVTLALEHPSAYALPYADFLYNADMEHAHYLFETDTVPFLQIVTGGSLPSFSPWLNCNAGNETLLLQMLDFNVWPAWLLTRAESHELADCQIADLYASRFADYLPEIVRVTKLLSPVLSQVAGAPVEDRFCPTQGLSVTLYANGRRVLVNYNDVPVDYDGVSVPARRAICTETPRTSS